MSEASNVVDIAPGYAGKAELLISALQGTLFQEQFLDMTLAEVLGAIELLKERLVHGNGE